MSDKHASEAELRARITDALVRDVGVSERMAQPFVDSILRCLAGERVYVARGARDYPVLQIRAALERGHSAKEVCDLFSLSRRQLHRIFPGGLPKPYEKAG
ncbi:hypothetical protein [Luteimonas notoginsengisoli]|uniref:Mor transcription activator domain-containing protein n=1 Tax=Luteimonas notoginsengisoli TaxID=1578200 RepID=A0ABV7URB9_9GAMM